jgi:hypothetical protein
MRKQLANDARPSIATSSRKNAGKMLATILAAFLVLMFAGWLGAIVVNNWYLFAPSAVISH